MPLETQPKLLRVLEMKEFERLGGNRLVNSDFRIIAATNRNLQEKVRNGSFRSDLFYRLNVISLQFPPLRERPEDIVPLAQHFINRSENSNLAATVMDSSVEKLLIGYSWPGNARELLNVIEQALIAAEDGFITTKSLPYNLQALVNMKFQIRKKSTLKESMRIAEAHVIQEALADAENNKSLAAKRLGIHRTLLYNKIKKLGIES